MFSKKAVRSPSDVGEINAIEKVPPEGRTLPSFASDFACPRTESALEVEELCILFLFQEKSRSCTFAAVLIVQVDGLIRTDFFITLPELGVWDISRSENMACFKLLRFPHIDKLRFPVSVNKILLRQVCDRFSQAQHRDDDVEDEEKDDRP